MTPLQTLELLTYANQIDPRVEVTAETTGIWHDMLGDLDVTRCRAAVVRHYRTSAERMMPSHIRALARTTTGPTGPVGDWCERCKGVHEPTEDCSVLVGNPSLWRRALEAGRSLRRTA